MNRIVTLVVPVMLIGVSFVTTSRAWQDTAAQTPSEQPPAEKPLAEIPSADEPAAAQPPAAAGQSVEPVADPMPETTAVPSADIPAAFAEALRKIRAGVELDRLRVSDLCEVKHYRQEKLQGYGMAVDLKETLSRAKPTVRAEEVVPPVAMPELLRLLESPAGKGDPALLAKLQEAGHLTLVAVTATVGPEGVRKGDRLDCEVRALDGKSLENAYLLPTGLALPGPAPAQAPAVAAGPIVASTGYRSGSATVAMGVLVNEDICDQFVKDNKITLVLNDEHADFLVVQEIVELINDELQEPLAKALNRFNVEVSLPEPFADDPVAFVTAILQLYTGLPAAGETDLPARPKP
jgi:flagellar basal body P-ring protein FlgI